MRLRRIQIETFEELLVLTSRWRYNVLIGENNTGKTAVLDALRFALRDVKLRRGCAFDATISTSEPTADLRPRQQSAFD